MAHETRTLIVEVTIAAPFETVWRALRDPAEIRRWHGWEYDGLEWDGARAVDTGAPIVSTYGLDEARLADIRERLDAWYPG